MSASHQAIIRLCGLFELSGEQFSGMTPGRRSVVFDDGDDAPEEFGLKIAIAIERAWPSQSRTAIEPDRGDIKFAIIPV
ncbi:MAG: hypothetical protein KGI75_29345, partial [Rhizobiaceae bacterium]|nr:hypothetical protein [Rhizobiaceae bacterium]